MMLPPIVIAWPGAPRIFVCRRSAVELSPDPFGDKLLFCRGPSARSRSAGRQLWVRSLETELRIELFDRRQKMPVITDAGRVITGEAKQLLQGIDTLRSRAQEIADDLEPELTLAIDVAFPEDVVMASLRGVEKQFPGLPVTLYTEYFDGAEQRLRDGAARLAVYSPGREAGDLEIKPFLSLQVVPAVATSHPLASVKGPLSREQLRKHVQLILTDRSPAGTALSGNIISPHVWRFADLPTRLKYLIEGFGWRSMPRHLVDGHTAAGRLRRFEIQGGEQRRTFSLSLGHLSGCSPGRAGRWLINDLRGHIVQSLRAPRTKARGKTNGRKIKPA